MEAPKFKKVGEEVAEKPKEKRYELVQIPTQHQLAILTPEEEVLSMEEATVNILNLVTEIKKGIVG